MKLSSCVCYALLLLLAARCASAVAAHDDDDQPGIRTVVDDDGSTELGSQHRHRRHHHHQGGNDDGHHQGNDDSSSYDFFYFVMQWPGAYCDTKKACCYPTTGKPDGDFGIHGLWPNRNDGSYPQSCDTSSSFDQEKVVDLLDRLETEWPTLSCPSNDGIKFWTHEWEKHGTCAESVFDEHGYFTAALGFKDQLNVLQALQSAGIQPDDQHYKVESIKQAISDATGFTPYIECNHDAQGDTQLYQLYFCVDAAGANLIECSVLPHGRGCGSSIKFPSF